MTFLTRLDVVNEMLGSMGEAPLNSEDDDHPLYPQASRTLDVASYRIQARSWWFNEELVELTPDAASKFIYLPNDTIRVDPRAPCLDYIQRGRRLYAPRRGSAQDKYKFDRSVTCWIIRHITFDELPVPAQLAVSHAAQVDFQRSYDGDAQRYQQLVIQARDSLTQLTSEHIRNMGVNLLHSSSIQSSMNRLAPATTSRGY